MIPWNQTWTASTIGYLPQSKEILFRFAAKRPKLKHFGYITFSTVTNLKYSSKCFWHPLPKILKEIASNTEHYCYLKLKLKSVVLWLQQNNFKQKKFIVTINMSAEELASCVSAISLYFSVLQLNTAFNRVLTVFLCVYIFFSDFKSHF